MVSIHSITIDVHMFQVVTSNPELESPLTRILRLDSMSILSKGNSVQPPVLGSLKNMRLGPPQYRILVSSFHTELATRWADVCSAPTAQVT